MAIRSDLPFARLEGQRSILADEPWLTVFSREPRTIWLVRRRGTNPAYRFRTTLELGPRRVTEIAAGRAEG